MTAKSKLVQIITQYEADLLADWLVKQKEGMARLHSMLKEGEIAQQSKEFLSELRAALEKGGGNDIQSAEFEGLRELLAEFSRSRALHGFTPTETATFVFSFKKPLFAKMQDIHADEGDAFFQASLYAAELLDQLGLYTMEIFQRSREEVIVRQQRDMLELSTPVVKLWDGVLALPVIGTLDSQRTQVVMEALLQKIVETNSTVAIIDITGVPTVDTLVAQHLIKTVTAARLMGAECIISGIRPQIAQTIVHLGINLTSVATKSTLADAFAVALRRSGRVVKHLEGGAKPSRKAAQFSDENDGLQDSSTSSL